MTILSIQRDWGPNVSIVRLVTTSSVQDVISTGWLGLKINQDQIKLVNNGPFEWRDNDTVLVDFRDPVDPNINIQSIFCDVFPGFRSLNPIGPINPNLQNIVAHAGGGQANATQLNIG